MVVNRKHVNRLLVSIPVGGSLRPQDPSYVTRSADGELYERIKGGEFCYVLNSRQMGKSSLRVRVMTRLREEGVSCVAIDVTLLGGDSVQQFYTSLMWTIVHELGLPEEIIFGEWLEKRLVLTPLQQLGELIEGVVLKEVEGDVVIFLDEIDKTLSLPFSDG